jgi:hypothetical protein
MVLAYLRRENLIKPDYPNGLRSRLRETMVLDAIACEGLSKQAMDQLAIHTALLPILTSQAREEHVNKMLELLSSAKCYSDLDRKKARSILQHEARKSTAEIYEILKKYNYWDKRPDFTPAQYREIIGRINELKAEARQNGQTDITD